MAERFLKITDYYGQIGATELTQICRSDDNNRLIAEDAAYFEIKGYLATKYKTDNIFKPLLDWSRTRTYKVGERLYLNANDYSNATAYTTYQTVLYNGYVYECILNSTGNIPTNATYWRNLGAKGYYCALAPAYNGATTYSVGNVVLYKGYNYICIVESLANLPTDTNYWSVASRSDEYYDYTSSLNQLPSNTTYWSNGDVRNSLIVRYMIDLAIYDLMSASPRQITELRVKRRDDALNFLEKLGSTTSLDVPLLGTDTYLGSRINFGSQEQLSHYY